MSLLLFIRGHREDVIREFATFAKALMPSGAEMTDAELRDHADDILTALLEDMALEQTPEEQHRKSQGGGSARLMAVSGRLHAQDRIGHGYTFQAVLAEFRALRASVLRLYESSGATDLRDVRRFNEGIDEALTESMAQFARETELLREREAVALNLKDSERRDRKRAQAALRESEEHLRRLNEQLEERVRQRTSEVRALFRRLVSAQEEERRRIAREMHDQLGQQMTALRLALHVWGSAAGDNPDHHPLAERAHRLAAALDESIDRLTWQLRPADLEHIGLSGALQNLAHTWFDHVGINTQVHVVGEGDSDASREIEGNLYRIAQEALHNVVKHAQATHVSILLEHTGDATILSIEDDGRGFDIEDRNGRKADGRLGLIGMRERAELMGGTLQIESSAGGTAVLVRIPTKWQQA